jgi:EF-P beta-lysylation protein EpmB
MQHTDLVDRGEPTGSIHPRGVSWHQELRQAVRSARELGDRLGIVGLDEVGLGRVEEQFPVVVPGPILRQVEVPSGDDPVLRQFLPSEQELVGGEGFVADAVGDEDARRAPGMLHKYQGRVLLIVTGACAVHCRYCFRRHYPYGEEPKDLASFEPALKEIEQDRSIREVILSGGDPLTRTDAWLGTLVSRLRGIDHLSTLRVHTRMPIVTPSRVTAELIDWMAGSRLTPTMVLHVNHAREIGPEAEQAVGRLREAGIVLLNQSVLLAGVNDSVEVLEELSRSLHRLGVLPYYLHQLDRVTGSAHFEVPVERGIELIEALRARLPGYLVPRYVREEPGKESKTPLG